jgi:PAS domain S-box-containing protein
MRSGALRIALIYISIAVAWIVVSDKLFVIYHNSLSPSLFLLLTNAKRFVFVSITGYLVYRLILAHEKKQTESEKEAKRNDDEVKKLAHIITRINNIIIITDKNNFITWVNKPFEDFTGYSFEEVAGYTPATFFIDGETDVAVFNSITENKKAMAAFSAEVNCHKKCGDKFWVKAEYTPLFDTGSAFIGYISVYSDITMLKQKEQEAIRQNDKLKEVAWLSSHEIRRPLANIIGLVNLMKMTPYMDEKVKIIDSINKSAEELDKIVHTINSTVGTELEGAETKIIS